MRDLIFDPPEVGCVLYLTGLPQSGDKIIDRSPYGHIGTIVGATWRFGSGGWYLDFDGTDDYIEIKNHASLNFTDAFTLESWIYRTAFGTQDDIIDKEPSYYLQVLATDILRLGGGAVGGFTSADGATSLLGNTWYHVAGTHNKDLGSNQTRVFVNGVQDGVATNAKAINTNTDVLRVGMYNGGVGAGWAFTGRIPRCRIYPRDLSDLELLNHYNQEKHLFGRV